MMTFFKRLMRPFFTKEKSHKTLFPTPINVNLINNLLNDYAHALVHMEAMPNLSLDVTGKKKRLDVLCNRLIQLIEANGLNPDNFFYTYKLLVKKIEALNQRYIYPKQPFSCLDYFFSNLSAQIISNPCFPLGLNDFKQKIYLLCPTFIKAKQHILLNCNVAFFYKQICNLLTDNVQHAESHRFIKNTLNILYTNEAEVDTFFRGPDVTPDAFESFLNTLNPAFHSFKNCRSSNQALLKAIRGRSSFIYNALLYLGYIFMALTLVALFFPSVLTLFAIEKAIEFKIITGLISFFSLILARFQNPVKKLNSIFKVCENNYQEIMNRYEDKTFVIEQENTSLKEISSVPSLAR